MLLVMDMTRRGNVAKIAPKQRGQSGKRILTSEKAIDPVAGRRIAKCQKMLCV